MLPVLNALLLPVSPVCFSSAMADPMRLIGFSGHYNDTEKEGRLLPGYVQSPFFFAGTSSFCFTFLEEYGQDVSSSAY
jgi:hypothetical protein